MSWVHRAGSSVSRRDARAQPPRRRRRKSARGYRTRDAELQSLLSSSSSCTLSPRWRDNGGGAPKILSHFPDRQIVNYRFAKCPRAIVHLRADNTSIAFYRVRGKQASRDMTHTTRERSNSERRYRFISRIDICLMSWTLCKNTLVRFFR